MLGHGVEWVYVHLVSLVLSKGLHFLIQNSMGYSRTDPHIIIVLSVLPFFLTLTTLF